MSEADGKPGLAGPPYCACGVMWPEPEHKQACEEWRAENEGRSLRPEDERMPSYEDLRSEIERLRAELEQANEALKESDHCLKLTRAQRDDARADATLMRGIQADGDRLWAERDDARGALQALRGEHAEALGAVARLTRERDEERRRLETVLAQRDEHDVRAQTLMQVVRLLIAGGGA